MWNFIFDTRLEKLALLDGEKPKKIKGRQTKQDSAIGSEDCGNEAFCIRVLALIDSFFFGGRPRVRSFAKAVSGVSEQGSEEHGEICYSDIPGEYMRRGRLDDDTDGVVVGDDQEDEVIAITSAAGWVFAFEGGAHILFRYTLPDQRFVSSSPSTFL